MQEPTETVIICAQQNFKIVRGLNPIQIEIEDDRVVNILKRYENVMYKLTPCPNIIAFGNIINGYLCK